jgi:hypothetical protein
MVTNQKCKYKVIRYHFKVFMGYIHVNTGWYLGLVRTNFNLITRPTIRYIPINTLKGYLISWTEFYKILDGKWATWGSWSSCTKSCSGGKEVRSRTCTNPATNYGGKDCVGDPSEERACNTHGCTGRLCQFKEDVVVLEIKQNKNQILTYAVVVNDRPMFLFDSWQSVVKENTYVMMVNVRWENAVTESMTATMVAMRTRARHPY